MVFRTTGAPEKFQFELQTYGIPTQILPFTSPTIDLSSELHNRWVRMQQLKSSSSSGEDPIHTPRRFDVLFGRGTTIAQYTGNLRAAHLVEMYRPKYEAADKFAKTEIAERIVTIIQESGGRFLKRENGAWVEADDNMAREKISHFFRKFRGTAPLALDANKPLSKVSPSASSSSKRSSSASPVDVALFPGKRAFTATLIHLQKV